MAQGPHLSLSLSRELWNELLAAALPVRMAGDTLDLAHNARQIVGQLGVRNTVRGLLEDRRAPRALSQLRDQARALWKSNRERVYQGLNDVVRVDGAWWVELSDLGTELRYGRQKVSADAYVRGVAEGTLYLLRENIEIPFHIERRLGASLAIGDIHYNDGQRAVIGSVQDLDVFLGDGRLMELMARVVAWGLEQQLPRVGSVPILRREQVQDLVGPMGGSLQVELGVDDVELVVRDDDLTLNVRFGFVGESAQ